MPGIIKAVAEVQMITDQQILEAMEACDGSATAAAKFLEMPRSTLRNRILRMKTRPAAVTVHAPMDPDLPIEELIARRKKQYAHKDAAEKARKLIPVSVADKKPIGVVFIGDPHVDDDGCDIATLERDALIIRDTDGMYGIPMGDMTNNWTGRLAHLYSEQSTTASEAWKLAEWFINLVPWLAVIGGNHDCWSGAGDPLKWMVKNSTYEPVTARLGLNFPNGKQVIINARHDFNGHSMWNPVHGPSKAAQMGWRDHILVCGHRHKSGYGLVKCPSSGLVSHAIQVATYKIHDRFGKERGLPDQNISPCVTAIIRPGAEERGLVTVFHDIEIAAQFLTFVRGQ